MPTFKAAPDHIQQAQLIRQSVWAQVSTRGYRMNEAQLVQATPSLQIRNEQVLDTEACDYVLNGEVTAADRRFFLVFSQNTIAAKLRLSRRSTNETLWEAHNVVDLTDGGLPLSLIGLSAGVWSAANNMSDDRNLMAVDSLARKLVASLPYRVSTQSMTNRRTRPWPEDIDVWLGDMAPQDQEQALRTLMAQPMTKAQSEAAYERLVNLAATPENWRNWVTSRMQRSEPEYALALFERSAGMLHADPQSHYLKARLLALLGRYDESVVPLMHAIHINPHQPLYFEALAHIELQRHEPQRAIAAFSKVTELNPGLGYAWLNIGLLAQSSGSEEIAVDALGNAGQIYLKSHDTNALEDVLQALDDMGERGSTHAQTKAAKLRAKVQELAPHKPTTQIMSGIEASTTDSAP